ncbi:MAG: hypothetical protein JWN75_240 [Candidatus Saccharibacteria bacterium]|nr:hypothetical protein [Candidatus Saccharibacteria bacterium]
MQRCTDRAQLSWCIRCRRARLCPTPPSFSTPYRSLLCVDHLTSLRSQADSGQSGVSTRVGQCIPQGFRLGYLVCCTVGIRSTQVRAVLVVGVAYAGIRVLYLPRHQVKSFAVHRASFLHIFNRRLRILFTQDEALTLIEKRRLILCCLLVKKRPRSSPQRRTTI